MGRPPKKSREEFAKQRGFSSVAELEESLENERKAEIAAAQKEAAEAAKQERIERDQLIEKLAVEVKACKESGHWNSYDPRDGIVEFIARSSKIRESQQLFCETCSVWYDICTFHCKDCGGTEFSDSIEDLFECASCGELSEHKAHPLH